MPHPISTPPATRAGRSRRQVLLGGAALLGAIGLGDVSELLRPGAAPAGAVPPDPLTVTVDLADVVGAMPARSLGFSFEKNTVPGPMFSAANAPLIGLFRLLGPGVLRLGGNSVDRVTWDPDGPGLTPLTVSPPDLVRLRAFLDAVDWDVIYGTPFLFSTAADVAAEAAAAAEALGARLQGFELANEPDLYAADDTAGPIAGTPAKFNARWSSFATALLAAVPNAWLTGPSTCLLQSFDGVTSPFPTKHPGLVHQLTQHYYRGFGFGPQNIDVLLSPDPDLDATLVKLRARSTELGIGYRLTETNSFANGGEPGVSNTFASALWGADLVLRAGAYGADGVNIHNSGAGLGYPAIVNVNGVVTEIRPLFHGLLLAAAAGHGPMPALAIDPTTPALRAHAVAPTPTALRVVLVNTGADDQTLSLDVGRPVEAASAARLLGSGLDATTSVTFAGAGVGTDGTWTPLPAEVLVPNGRRLAVAVPAASAALVEITLAALPPTTTSTTTRSTSTSTSTSTLPTTTTTTAPASTSTTSTTGAPAASTTSAPSSATDAVAADPVVAAPTFAG